MIKWSEVGSGIFLIQDTCNVYVIRNGTDGVIIDFGSGDVLDVLDELGISNVAAVLVTHHHRDQVQGLDRAVNWGIPVWVPHTEQDFFHSVDFHWQSREVYNNYNGRQDRFSLLEPIPIAGTLKDYNVMEFAGLSFRVVPTPGHTTGSVSFLLEKGDKQYLFAGDLLYKAGKLWSLSATQWTYNGGEGIALTTASLLEIEGMPLSKIFTSHGGEINQPAQAVQELIAKLRKMLAFREQNPRLFSLRDKPYQRVTEHLLMNRTSMANSYVVLSRSGKALLVDYGYDFIGGIAAGADRASRRPWLYTMDALKEQYGVTKIDVAIPTHYHDDHVAGFNLLRDVEKTEVWASLEIAHILENPTSYDLPCIWYDHIKVDRVLPVKQSIGWEEYLLTLYPLSGHTRYAVAINIEVDGQNVAFVGDQYQGAGRPNYVYANRFSREDFTHSALLLDKLKPDLILSGHSAPLEVTPEYLHVLKGQGAMVSELHSELLPVELDLGMEGFVARITPYQITLDGNRANLEVEVVNPFNHHVEVAVSFVLPSGFTVAHPNMTKSLKGNEKGCFKTIINTVQNKSVRRGRIAVDVEFNNTKFGQQAEALVTTDIRAKTGNGVKHDCPRASH